MDKHGNKRKIQSEKDRPYLMENMTVNEVRQALKRTRTVLVPLGVVEQHGYHLPLSTDIHNAYQIAKRVSQKIGSLIAPPLNYAFSGGTLPGTINISPQTMSLVVSDICQSLAEQGFSTIILVMGHGGTENLNALRDATTLFLRRNPQWRNLVLVLAPVWEFSPTWMKAFKEKDYHAAYIETSLMLYWAPDLVRKTIKLDSPSITRLMKKHQDNYLVMKKKINSRYVIPHLQQRSEIKVGIMGDPTGSNWEVGRKVADECVRGIIRLIKKIEMKM